MRDSTERDQPRVWWKEAIKRRVIRQFDAAFVSGRRSSRYLQGLGFPEAKIFHKLNVVDNDYFDRESAKARLAGPELRRRLGLPEHFFLGVFRFTREKNLGGLLAAHAQYRANAGPRAWPLVLVGDGPEHKALEGMIAKRSLGGSVVLPGFKQYEEIPIWYGLASAFVLPSVAETWGYVVNEAEACGLPVLVSEQCGCCEDLVRPGLNGWTFNPRDPGKLRRLVHLGRQRGT